MLVKQVMEILENLVSGRGAGDMRPIAVSSKIEGT
jgi:hypothetical protein